VNGGCGPTGGRNGPSRPTISGGVSQERLTSRQSPQAKDFNFSGI